MEAIIAAAQTNQGDDDEPPVYFFVEEDDEDVSIDAETTEAEEEAGLGKSLDNELQWRDTLLTFFFSNSHHYAMYSSCCFPLVRHDHGSLFQWGS